MVGSWLLKILIGIVVAGVLVIEGGSPLIAKAQADDAATQIADDAALRLRRQFKQATLDKACATEGAKHDVEVVRCDFDSTTSEVVVTARKQARSIVLKNISATADWYVQDVTARSKLK